MEIKGEYIDKYSQPGGSNLGISGGVRFPSPLRSAGGDLVQENDLDPGFGAIFATSNGKVTAKFNPNVISAPAENKHSDRYTSLVSPPLEVKRPHNNIPPQPRSHEVKEVQNTYLEDTDDEDGNHDDEGTEDECGEDDEEDGDYPFPMEKF